MSQRQQLERIFEIDRRIRSGEYPNAEKIATALEVSKRVIYNDRIFMITRLGAPIEFNQKYNGWYYTNETWTLPNIMATEGEVLAFLLSVEVARRYLGTSLESTLRSAVEKITNSIKGPVSVDLETLKANYTFASPALAGSDEITLSAIHNAINKKQRMHILYYTASRNVRTWRDVSPYHLYYVSGEWYLIAFDDLRQDFRNFAVGRIEDFNVLDNTFTIDKSFSIQEWMKKAFQSERGGETVEVAIRFDEFQARYIRERRWHESQVIEEKKDGSLILRFKTGGLNEVKRWVMQYGSHAEILMPKSLRDDCLDEINKMKKVYKTRKSK